jgi:hypothetical protein
MSPSRYVTAEVPPPDPPEVSGWRLWRAHPECSKVEVAVQQYTDGLVRGHPMLIVCFLDSAGELIHGESVVWEPTFERYLLDELKLPSRDRSSEILRFKLLLHEEFKPIWREVDGGYFDAVLVKVVGAGDYSEHPAIRAVLQHAHPGNPSPRNLQKTSDFIERALAHVGGRIRFVTHTPDEADDILVHALAAWLDDRFSVTSRRSLGMLPELGTSESG